MSLEHQLNDEQKKGPLFFALKKIAPRLTKDLRKVPEEQLKNGMSALGMAIAAAADPNLADQLGTTMLEVINPPEQVA